MASPDQSTIAQLLYPDQGVMDFARMVAELDAVLTRRRGGEIEVTWDCNDLVTFDVPETRILLAWSETDKRGPGGCLTVSVGPNPAAADPLGKTDHELLCSRLVERIEGRFAPAGVMWRQHAGPVNADYVDALVDDLPEVSAPALPPIDSILDVLSRVDLHLAELQARPPHPRSIGTLELSLLAMDPKLVELEEPAKPAEVDAEPLAPWPLVPMHAPTANAIMVAGFAEAANDPPDLPAPRNEELIRVRDALYPEVADKVETVVGYSTQMRLAVHCLNATLILVWAPLGAAVMTYSVLRGEDMRLSARLMAVSGTFFAIAHSSVGETVAAMAMSLT